MVGYIIPVGTTKDALSIAKQMRGEGVKVDIDLSGRGPSKNLQYADSLGIPFTIFIGENELKQKKVKLKNMQSGNEQLITIKDAVKKIKS